VFKASVSVCINELEGLQAYRWYAVPHGPSYSPKPARDWRSTSVLHLPALPAVPTRAWHYFRLTTWYGRAWLITLLRWNYACFIVRAQFIAPS